MRRLYCALLALALLSGISHMSVFVNDDFESGSLASYPQHVGASIVSDATLGGTKCVQTDGTSGTGYLSYGQFDYEVAPSTEFDWGTTPIPSSGRNFTLAACFDNSYEPWNGDWDPNQLAFQFGRNPPTSGNPYHALVQLQRVAHDADTVGLFLWNPCLNHYIGMDTTSASPIEVVIGPRNTPLSIRITGTLATITGGTTSGGGSAASDGSIYVYVDGALVFRKTSYALGYHINNQGPSTYWNTYANVPGAMEWAYVGVMGRLKNLYISDDLTDPGSRCPAASLRVDKVTVPAASSQAFSFTAGGGLTPDAFNLSDGESAIFYGLNAGGGYSIAETPVSGWSTSISVSNGSDPDNLTVADGVLTVVTVTNTENTDVAEETGPCCGSTGPSGSPTSTGYNGTGTTSPTGTTPPTLTPRVIPPGGAPPSYTSCNSGGGVPASASNPVDAQDLNTCTTPLVHCKWTLGDGSVRRYGKRDFTSGNGSAVTKRVLKWGGMSQVLADRRGSFQANQFTVTLDDTDRAIRSILSNAATKYVDGKEFEVLIEEAAKASLSIAPLVLSRGVVTDYRFPSDMTVDLTITDPLGYRYSSVSIDRPIPHRLCRSELFPDMPEETAGRPLPIIYGEESDDLTWLTNPARIPVGICPAIYVGKANAIAGTGIPGGEWEAFVICGHAVSCIQSVFASNLLDPAGPVRMPTSTYGTEFLVPGINVPKYYDITGTDGVTERVCLLFATGDRALAHIEGRIPITVNPVGIEDVGDGSGLTITEIARQFQHFLSYWVVQNYMTGNWGAVPTFNDGTGKVRTSSFVGVNTVHAERLGTSTGYIGSMYLGDQKSARDWAKEFQLGGDMRLGVNHQGQLLVMSLDPTQDASAFTVFDARTDIIDGSFKVDPALSEIANIKTYEYGVEPATGRVAGAAQTIRHPESISHHGERPEQATVNRATRDKTTADDVAARGLMQSAEAPVDVSFDSDLRGTTLRLGLGIKVTHYLGVGPLGWTNRNLVTTGVTAYPDEDNFSTTIQAEDWHDLLAQGNAVLTIDAGAIDTATIG